MTLLLLPIQFPQSHLAAEKEEYYGREKGSPSKPPPHPPATERGGQHMGGCVLMGVRRVGAENVGVHAPLGNVHLQFFLI